jgi:hypothetical protein
MAPPAADIDVATSLETGPVQTKTVLTSSLLSPLKYSGSLDQYKSREVTPVIGREFQELQLSEILSDDNKIRDLAITGTLSHKLGLYSYSG